MKGGKISKDYKRKIEWFNKNGSDIIVGEENITHLSTSFLKDLLNVENDYDPKLIFDYKMSEEIKNKIQPYIKHKINTKKYDYFIATYQP